MLWSSIETLFTENRFPGGFGSTVFFYYSDSHMANIKFIIYNNTRKTIYCVKINVIASTMSDVSGDLFTHIIN